MNPTIVGSSLIFGVDEAARAAPILNLPADAQRVRRRLRNTAFAWAFVQTPTGIRQFALKRVDGGLELALEQGVNVRQAA